MATRKHSACLALAVVGALAASSYAQVLFTTQDDFAGWQDNTTNPSNQHFVGTPVASPDSDGSNVNGLGNTTASGATGTAGSEQLTWEPGAGTYSFFFSPGEQANAGFLSAIDPGSTAGNLVAYSGTITLDSTLPAGSLGIVLNYDNNFGQFSGTTTAPNANGFSTTVISYTVNATSLSYFQFGVIFNSSYQGTFNFDNIKILPASNITFDDVSANWVTNGSGPWETATNWSSNPQIPGGSPDNAGAQITFDNNGGSITANPTVTLSQPATCTFLQFGNQNGGPNPNYTINSGSPAATITVNSEIDSYSGTHIVNVPVSTASSNFYYDVLAGSNLTIGNFTDTSYGNLTKVDPGTLNIGAQNLHLTLTVDGTLNFIDNKSSGFLFGLNVNSDGIVNIGKNSFNTNTITSDSGTQGIINIPIGGTLYTAEYVGNGAPGTMYYNGLFTGGGSVVIGEGQTSTDTSQVIYGNSAVFYGNNIGFSGTVTVGSSFPVGGPNTSPAVFTLEVGSASNLGDGSATNQVILDGGTLQSIASFNGTQNVVVTAKNGTIDTDGPAGGTGSPIPGGTAITLGSVSSSANGTLTKINPGQLTVSKITGVSLIVNGGTVQLAPNGTAAGASSLSALTLLTSGNVPQGSLDITNNAVTIAAPAGNDPITTIVGYLQTGYDNGKWDGAGIQSSAVAAQPGTGIGYADGNTDAGTAAAAGTILVMDTWLGDVNLSGSVTSADLTTLTANLGKSGMDWAHGDLNYDGIVNADDLGLFMLGSAEFKAGGSQPVPEPATVGLLATAVALWGRRRR